MLSLFTRIILNLSVFRGVCVFVAEYFSHLIRTFISLFSHWIWYHYSSPNFNLWPTQILAVLSLYPTQKFPSLFSVRFRIQSSDHENFTYPFIITLQLIFSKWYPTRVWICVFICSVTLFFMYLNHVKE